MKLEPSLGKPTEPGIYAARQWYAWRILEWHDGKWWHVGRQCEWPKKAEIEAFVGPLPVIARDFSVSEAKAVLEDWERIVAPSPLLAEVTFKPVQEYDL